jgi:hypothetical protein
MKKFHGFDTTKFIANILENEFFVKDLVDILFSFVLQVAKKDVNLYPQTNMLSSHLLNSILLFFFTNML